MKYGSFLRLILIAVPWCLFIGLIQTYYPDPNKDALTVAELLLYLSTATLAILLSLFLVQSIDEWADKKNRRFPTNHKSIRQYRQFGASNHAESL